MEKQEDWLITRCLSSLEKVFADEELSAEPYHRGSALRGETFAFQVAYRAAAQTRSITVSVESPLSESILVRVVGLVPSELPCQRGHDEYVLRTTAGLYPDPLFPIDGPDASLGAFPGTVTGIHYQWRSVWVTVELGDDAAAGVHPIVIRFTDAAGERHAEERFELDVVGAALPPQTLIHTEWFHCDCLANYYGVEAFSEAHWGLIERYLATAVRHGMNMVLTPLFTPPLDTKEGGERLTVQLVDVKKEGDAYSFGFDRLTRWIELCDRVGVRYFEFSHLFTQWGAKHAPKIMAEERGEVRRIFGWETDATGEAYKSFLGQFLPALKTYIREHGLENRSYFHVSDEPFLEHLPWYRSASELVQSHVGEFPIIDALSNFEYYDLGLVKRPIPTNNHLEPFLERGVPDLWTYYACVQYREGVSNRFFNMPSARNRVLGVQLYKFRIAGFLHWGYNFWNTQYSLRAIDPYRVTDAGCGFPSGDAFLVYPGAEGPVESIRLEVLNEAMQDLRALQLLESLVGRDRVLELIEDGLEEPLTFKRYPRNAAWLLQLRASVNAAIQAAMVGVG